MLYTWWYDADKTHSLQHRIQEAIAVYAGRFGQQPNTVLVSEDEDISSVSIPGVVIRKLQRIGKNNYWAGREG
jgi:hypothetical protein